MSSNSDRRVQHTRPEWVGVRTAKRAHWTDRFSVAVGVFNQQYSPSCRSVG